MGKNKGNAKKTVYEGRLYASALEARYARHLNVLRAAGEILEWEPQPCRLPLLINDVRVGYYTPDFKITGKDGSMWYVDTKGWIPREWPFRLKVIRACHPTIDLRIVMRGDF